MLREFHHALSLRHIGIGELEAHVIFLHLKIVDFLIVGSHRCDPWAVRNGNKRFHSRYLP